MKMSRLHGDLAQLAVDAIVVGVFEKSRLEGPAADIDRMTGGMLTRLLEAEEISTKPTESTSLLLPSGLQTRNLLVVGLGKRDQLDAGAAFQIAGAAARKLSARRRGQVVFTLGSGWSAELHAAAIAGAIVGCQGQDLYRTEKKRFEFDELFWTEVDEATCRIGQILGDNVNLARRLVNEPPQILHPESFARQAERVAAEAGLQIDVWDKERLQSERCGALLAVARGSARTPRLVIMTHAGAPAESPLLALVGKGVTFDSGGLSLKPTDGMKTMKCDMAGAASVLAAMRAIAQLKLPLRAVGLMGLVENMPGPDAYKLGDVLTARNGRTIEVHNTDAEGRLVLADALCVAVDLGAAKIIDVATLTGACVVALGLDVSGLMSNDSSWCDEVAMAARACGEPAWQLPMFADYATQIQSEVADIKNTGDGRWAGAITAAKFLEEFVGSIPWTHIDIAGPSFLEKPKPWIDAGGSGVMVRTLTEVARRWPNATRGPTVVV